MTSCSGVDVGVMPYFAPYFEVRRQSSASWFAEGGPTRCLSWFLLKFFLFSNMLDLTKNVLWNIFLGFLSKS